jgi:hypothetical protein
MKEIVIKELVGNILPSEGMYDSEALVKDYAKRLQDAVQAAYPEYEVRLSFQQEGGSGAVHSVDNEESVAVNAIAEKVYKETAWEKFYTEE